jgi:hypothetical protein
MGAVTEAAALTESSAAKPFTNKPLTDKGGEKNE